MCCLNAATAWWAGPIILHSLPPKGRQVREYITARGCHSSSAWAYTKGRAAGMQPLSNMPSSEEGLSEAQVSMSQTEPMREVWDLDVDQLHEVLGALQTGMIQRMKVTLWWGHLGEIWGSLGAMVKAYLMMRKMVVIPDGRGERGMMSSQRGQLQGVIVEMGASVCPQWPGPGKTLLIKHHIELTNKMPFKECYYQILPHSDNHVKAHLQEMLDISIIWKIIHIALGPE